MNMPRPETGSLGPGQPVERVASLEASTVVIEPAASDAPAHPASRSPRLQAASDQPAGSDGADPEHPSPPLNPGDEAAPGTAGTGETFCPVCGGDGTVDGVSCRTCGGTGQVTVGIGGA